MSGSGNGVRSDGFASGVNEESIVTNRHFHRPSGLQGLCVATAVLALSSLGQAQVPMPVPADYQGLRIVEIDVPDADILKLLQDEGMRGLACTPAPGEGPWLLDADGEALLDALGLEHRDLVEDLPAFITQRNAERRAARGARGGDFYSDFRTLDEFNGHTSTELVASASRSCDTDQSRYQSPGS